MRIICVALLLVAVPGLARAQSATKATSGRAIADAQVAIRHAAALDDQWTPTIAAFKAAQAAARKGDYPTATRQAKRARVLAGLSIGQANAQKKLWRNEVAH